MVHVGCRFKSCVRIDAEKCADFGIVPLDLVEASLRDFDRSSRAVVEQLKQGGGGLVNHLATCGISLDGWLRVSHRERPAPKNTRRPLWVLRPTLCREASSRPVHRRRGH